MVKPRSILKALPPPKVSKSISLDGAVWDSVDTLRERIKQMDVAVAFEVHEVIEGAVRDAVATANRELDAMKARARGAP
jgi:hypothetical protein